MNYIFILFLILSFILALFAYWFIQHPPKIINEGFNEKNIVLITSKIITSNKKFNSGFRRSIYNKEERYKQTIDTIESIRKYIPNSYILFIDNSHLPQFMKDRLASSVDTFLNPYQDQKLSEDTNSKSKALCECSQTRYAINHLKNLKINWQYLFKLTGRYIINESFDYSLYDNKEIIFRKQESDNSILSKLQEFIYGKKIKYQTSFYKISRGSFNDYQKAINDIYISLKNDPDFGQLDWELILPANLNNIKNVPNLGITINCASFKMIERV